MLIHTYDSIISIENLLKIWERFLRGKRGKKDVVAYQLRLANELKSLHSVLSDRSYVHSGYLAFNLSDPKPRNIHKATVRDRVVHHLLYKTLYPYFDQRFIYDSYSCREEKGTHRALNRFKIFARKVSKNNTRTCYVLKGDIRKFFASIDHEILRTILKRHIADPELLGLVDQVLKSFHTTRRSVGLPLGNLTSQLLVNVYMNEFDRYIKQELQVKYYIRYADDFAILSDHKLFLEEILVKLNSFLNNTLHLTLNPDKVYIKTYSSGVDFLGWVHFPYHRQLRTTTKRKITKRVRWYPKKETVASYRGLLRHGDTHDFQQQVGLVRGV
jgi:retron-type reverse transcriptase